MKYHLVILTGVFTFFITATSSASSGIKLPAELSRCAEIANNESRLHCFDGLVKKSALPEISATALVVAPKVVKDKTQAEKVDDFAKGQVKKTVEEQGLQSITATISKLKQLLRGQWVIYLENGQKWQQKDSDKIKLKVGDKIRIKKSAMGAIYLYKEGSHRSIRVKRLK